MTSRRPRRPVERQVIELAVGGPAAGGTCVGHVEGATAFVAGALPGERVRAEVTSARKSGRLLFARVIDVIEPSGHRVAPPCPVARECGGCDLQHVAVPFQSDWKSQVLRDQLTRIGGVTHVGGVPLSEAVAVEPVPVPGKPPGLGWRTRATLHVDAEGRPGFHAAASHRVVPAASCPVLVDELQPVFSRRWPGEIAVSAGQVPTMTSEADPGRLPAGWRRSTHAIQEALGRPWRTETAGFWQGHVRAPEVLVDAVREALGPRPGEHLVDLYSGVGLFGASLAHDVGPTGRVVAVEGDEGAVRCARRNVHDLPWVELVASPVASWLRPDTRADLVVLDPPRAGAKAEVVAGIGAMSPRAVAYVACDGAALARDAATFIEMGWRLERIRAFDLFPMTHHVEAVATLLPPT